MQTLSTAATPPTQPPAAAEPAPQSTLTIDHGGDISIRNLYLPMWREKVAQSEILLAEFKRRCRNNTSHTPSAMALHAGHWELNRRAEDLAEQVREFGGLLHLVP